MKFKIFLFFILIYLSTSGGHLYSLDGLTFFSVTKAMVEEGTFRMEDGNFSSTNLGLSFFAIPFYLVGKLISMFLQGLSSVEITRGACSTFNSFVTALTCVIFFNLLRAFSISAKASFLTTLLYGIGSLAWPYSKYFYTQPLTGLCLLGATSGLFQLTLTKDESWCYRASLWTGLLLFVRLESIILFFPLAVLYILVSKSIRKKIFLFLIFPFIFIVFSLVYNYIKAGTSLNLGSGYGSLGDFSTPLLAGLYGNLFSCGKGLFVYVPVILLSIIGLRFFKYKKEAVFILLTIVAYLIPCSKYIYWDGDWSWGPRYMVTLIPLFFIPMGFLLERIKFKSIPGILVLFISLLSIFITLISLPISFNEYLRDVYSHSPIEIKLIDSEVKIRPHHFIPQFSPLRAQVVIIKNRIKIFRETGNYSVVGYDYHRRKIVVPVFDFWYINLLLKASYLKNYILILLFSIFILWSFILCSIIREIVYCDTKKNKI